MRKGPNLVGFFGILQPISDGLKLFQKNLVLPYSSSSLFFMLSPTSMFLFSFINWWIIPFDKNITIIFIENSLLWILAFSGLNVYCLLLAGWSSNSNYSLLGGFRAIAQMISYEICLSLSLFPMIMISESLNFLDIIDAQSNCWFIFTMFPSFVCFFTCCPAETSRTPFDLPEAESELVSGYNIEYSGFFFALFFLAEYANIILMSILICFFSSGGYTNYNLLFFITKVCFILLLFILIRSVLPRYKFNQLLILSWKFLVPIEILYLVFLIGIYF